VAHSEGKMLWVMEGDGFYIESLEQSSHYRELLRLVPDEIFLDELAEDLTDSVLRNHVTRLSMIRSLGYVAVKRRKEIEEILRHRVGNKIDWKVISAGLEFERAGVFNRFMACFFAPLPVVWIRIAL